MVKRSNPSRPRRPAPAKYSGAERRRRPRGVRKSRLRIWLEHHGFWVSIVRMVMAGFIIVGLMLMYFAAQLPEIRSLNTIKKQQGITVLSADGRVVANYGDVYGNYIPYDELPKPLVQAVIATEDRRFFEHHGVDFFGIARAMLTNLMRGHLVQGGSTVTQQVAKNVFLTPERSIKRKLQEVMLAFWLESRFSKKEIMAIYLNRVYLGGGAFGVDAAAHRYFNKGARELNLYESALLAGLLKAPSRYSPAANTDRAKARVYQVLLNMVDAGFLKEKDVKPTMMNYAKANGSRGAEGGDVRYYTDWIVDQIPDLTGGASTDMVVATTLDTTMQAQAQDTLLNVVTMQGEKKNVSQGAMVVMRPDGAVLAVVGGLNYAKSQFNRAVQAKRQPGSSFKLFVYLAALEAGLTPLSTVEDAPIMLQVGTKVWAPENFEVGGYRGDIPMVEAIRYSLNTVSVRLSQYAGINKVAEMAMRLGIPSVPENPSIALGAVEATLLEMTNAYAHLPNGGNRVGAYGITSIKTRDGHEIYKREEPESVPMLAKGVVEMMNYMLKDVATRGTGAKAALAKYQVAGKTGTSQDYKDAWFVGFTTQLVTGVWVGNDNNKPMKKITGGSIPATIWHDFMTLAMEGMPSRAIPSSEGSGEGLLPWLFGGSRSDDDVSDSAPSPTGPSSSPSLMVRPREPGGSNSIPVEQPISLPPDEEEDSDVHEIKSNDILSKEFWQKLEDKIPEKGNVEYNYPGQNRHRR